MTMAIQRKHSQGFTLIEMMVVIAIMAILAMMAAPSFGKMIAQKRTQQGAMDIIYAFNQARSQAALSGQSTTLTVSNTNHDFVVTSGTSTIANFTLNDSLTIQSNNNFANPIRVNANGKTSANTVYFRVCDANASGIDGYSVWIYPSGLTRYIRGKSTIDTVTDTDC